MMRRYLLEAAGVLLALAAFSSAAAAERAPVDAMDARQLETLLSADANVDLRKAALQGVVARAQGGDGWSAFLLGALYRSGKDHPAKLMDRDPDTARHWLELCVDRAPRCPLLALTSLAELELAENNVKPAMQWAQAYAVLDRELGTRQAAKGDVPERRRDAELRTSYHAYLLERLYRRMPTLGKDADDIGLAWFTELRKQRGKALDRMFFAALDGDGADSPIADEGLEPSAENQRRRTIDGSTAQPRQPALGLFLVRGNPAGGPAEAVETIESLPNPMKTFGLKGMARSMRTKPYEAPAGTRRYSVLPLSYGRESFYLYDKD